MFERPKHLLFFPLTFTLLFIAACATTPTDPSLYPAPGAVGVSPDTPIRLTFSAPPRIGDSGFIRVYDTSNGALVDEIDLSVAPSPLPDGRFPPNTNQAAIFALGKGSEMRDFQVNTIGGTDFHFQPIIVTDNTARIYLHNNKLKPGRQYKISVDASALPVEGHGQAREWVFSTRSELAIATGNRLIVSADGTGDFSTLQGAIDFAPDTPASPFEIFIRNGDYEEIVMVKDKSNLIIRGESREGVRVHYANNSAFNPPRGAPSRRPAFSLQNVSDVQLSNFTIENDFIGQAEALLARGERIIIHQMALNGSGDALTTYGSIYMQDSTLTGDGDTILGYATLFCLRCTISSRGPFTWTRTPANQHGNIFVDSQFNYLDEPLPWSVNADNPAGTKAAGVLARLPRNGPASSRANFPHAEMVLINSVLNGVPPIGWGPIESQTEFDWSKVRFMEFNSIDETGEPIDMSTRHPIVQHLSLTRDATLLQNYQNPAYVFDGWVPQIK